MSADDRSGPRFTVIVLSWNGRDDTAACLKALEAALGPQDSAVVVDQGSTDGSLETIRELAPWADLIDVGQNVGFTAGNNIGIRHALEQGTDWIVLLNNDANVGPNSIEALRRTAMERPQAGVLGGVLFFAHDPERIEFAGQRFNALIGYSGRPRGHGRRDGPRYRRVVRTDRAVGAFMAVSREAVDAVGLLDEELFFYVEDVDWSLRIARAGFEVLIVPEARAWHKGSASGGGAAISLSPLYYGTRNTVRVAERHRPLGPFATRLRRWLVVATFALHATRTTRARRGLDAVLQGYGDAVAGRLGPRSDGTQRRPATSHAPS